MSPLYPLLSRPEVAAHVARLRSEFQSGRLTLFLGAGVSMASGLPSWSALLATLYYTAVNMDWAEKWKPYPNYLFAMGEWLLKQSGDPPEVIAGKVERYFNSPDFFQSKLKETLYLKWRRSGRVVAPGAQALRRQNRLVDAVALLCEQTTQKGKGLKAVVTTNYDSLLELALAEACSEVAFKPMWKASQKLRAREKGIFHVHGYLPHKGVGSTQKDILLTEAQYQSGGKRSLFMEQSFHDPVLLRNDLAHGRHVHD